MSLANLGHVQARMGDLEGARRILQQLSDASKDRYTPAMAFAVVHLGLGDHDQALTWLEKTYDERFNRLAYLRREAIWAPLRQELPGPATPHQPAGVKAGGQILILATQKTRSDPCKTAKGSDLDFCKTCLLRRPFSAKIKI